MLKRILLVISIIIFASFPIYAQSPTYDELLNNLEITNSELEKVYNENIDLKKELTEKDKIIIMLRDEVVDNQEEIVRLRKTIEKVSAQVDKDNLFFVGGGVTYPLGGEILVGGKLDILPIGVHIGASIDKKLDLRTSVGIQFYF